MKKADWVNLIDFKNNKKDTTLKVSIVQKLVIKNINMINNELIILL